MKIKTIISILFLLIVSLLYFLGICEWDFYVYIICVISVLLFMIVFIRQERKQIALEDRKNNLELEIKKNSAN